MLGRLRRAGQVLKLGAHPVEATHSYAVQRVSGVLVVFWSIAAGAYLTLGGANQLQAIVWQPLVTVTRTATLGVLPAERAYLVIGAALLTGGLTGYLGLATEWRWLSLISCSICSAWHGYVLVLFGSEDIEPPRDDDNFLAFYAALALGVCVLRFLLLFAKADVTHDDVLHL